MRLATVLRYAAGRPPIETFTAPRRQPAIAAEARRKVDRADRILQPLRQLAQYLIAGRMAVGVVDRLEEIDIDNGRRERPAVPLRSIEQGRQVAVQIVTVVEPGQAIGNRHGNRALIRAAQLLLIAVMADLVARPGDKFVLVDGLVEIIIDPKVETLAQVFIVAFFDHHQQGDVARLVTATNLRADPQPVGLAEIDANDDEIKGFTERRQSFLFVGHAGDLIFFGQNTLDHLAVIGLILDHKNTSARGIVLGRVRIVRGAKLKAGVIAKSELVERQLRPQKRAHARKQGDIVYRLRQKVVGPGVDTADAVFRAIEGGHHDDRDVVQLGIVLEAPAHLITVHARHHDIQKDEIGRHFRDFLQRFKAVASRLDFVIFSGQFRFEKLHVERLIVNNQDAR